MNGGALNGSMNEDEIVGGCMQCEQVERGQNDGEKDKGEGRVNQSIHSVN